MHQTAAIVDVLSMAFVFGATAWFFFLQAPLLLNKLGRERFVPIQMMATRLLAKALLVGTALMVAGALGGGAEVTSPLVMTAGAALLGALVNERVIIPKALRAGGRGHREIRGKDEMASTTGFAADGVGEATSVLHRLVVLFVVIMLAGVVSHALLLTGVIAA